MTMAPGPHYMRLPPPIQGMADACLGARAMYVMHGDTGWVLCLSEDRLLGVYPGIVYSTAVTASWYLIKLEADESVYGSCPSIYSGKT